LEIEILKLSSNKLNEIWILIHLIQFNSTTGLNFNWKKKICKLIEQILKNRIVKMTLILKKKFNIDSKKTSFHASLSKNELSKFKFETMKQSIHY